MVARAYTGLYPMRALGPAEVDSLKSGRFAAAVRADVVEKVCRRWRGLDSGYVANIIRGVCSGKILASPLWRARLEELSGGAA